MVELKAGCAATMAEGSKLRRALDDTVAQAAQWEKRAELALKADREDMAREALEEKIAADEHVESLRGELAGFDELVGKCREDIRLLEERIRQTRDRQRLLVERHSNAKVRRQAREQVRNADNAGTMRRFDSLEQRITRMENEAELAYNPEEQHSDFHRMEREAAVDEQLEALRRKLGE